ncbi:hypothetical protein QR680_018807 [Steinernema hermaphroditum]|uniref:Peptidase M12B domain-containing protein n=1 Tax=Steinernema hermaphroditum TaxID=289476 RepID=A0AA39LRD9_9BILA|nr:hypothetical protein QR680_018807 [Steinernema hermaphroditum]
MARCLLLTLLALVCVLPVANAIISFFTPEELRYTFGVEKLTDVPNHDHVYPEVVFGENGTLERLLLTLEGQLHQLDLTPVTNELVGPSLTVIHRGNDSNTLDINPELRQCHYHHYSNHTYAAVSNCDGNVKGIIVKPHGAYVIHPMPDRHVGRFKRSASGHGLHVLYKREAPPTDFCGLDSTISSEELIDDESSVNEDVFVVGQRLSQQGDLIVELAIFVDELLWRHFSSKYGGYAMSKLQDYALTMLNNIQIMYRQPSAVPQLTFRVVRYEVLSTQPSAMAPHLHNYGHAQQYLDRFCRYQKSLGVRDWDHALLLTGYDIHRGSGSRSISGIARLDGMCDPWNTCTLAEGLDFTSAFIGTHELGHSVGMRHDEPYCPSRHIMSSSLGPGKVTWSTCSLRDYHAFLQRLDSRGKNCLRQTMYPEKMAIRRDVKPGQLYDANVQCSMMHGPGYQQVTPRQDHYDGICYMMWCGQSTFGRIITSHPALEGTFCGPSKWCQLGRCVPWYGNTPTTTLPPYTVPTTTRSYVPTRVDGDWSQWSSVTCQLCTCPPVSGGIGLAMSTRTCSNPAPSNGGSECEGASNRALVCNRNCASTSKSVDQFISEKCSEHKRIKDDKDLTGTGSQLMRYPQRACKVFCDVVNRFGSQRNYRFFGDNLPDGTPCGNDKYCLDGECLALSCESSALITRDLSCPAEKCPEHQSPYPNTDLLNIKGQWGTWSLWTTCTDTCGGGTRQRARACNINGRCDGEAVERVTCGTDACPAIPNTDPQWTEWTSWNQCSVSCGRGSQARYRRCQTNQHTIAYSCPGSTMDIRNCEEAACPPPSNSIVGLWATWGDWSSCSRTCGPGIKTRNRYCTNEPCDGSGSERMSCNLAVCPGLSQQWTGWSAWSECSRLCGKGLRTRTRSCPSYGSCFGSSIDQQFCNEQACVVATGQWSGWSAWGVCSVSCGAGVKRRTRHCQQGNCLGDFRESATCNDGACQQNYDATWGGWGYWSTCSQTCGSGIRKRVRKCYGTGKCSGNEYEKQQCYTREC